MNNIAKAKASDRADLFRETAARMGLRPALVEKDFWVSWTLRQLFSIPVLEGRILFKGGTSLSKIFRAIERFSEDIDLAVNYEMLGFTGDRHPSVSRSEKQRKKLHNEMLDVCCDYVKVEFVSHLRQRFAHVLGTHANWRLDARDNPSAMNIPRIHFAYPPSLTAGESLDYVGPEVLLEPVIRSPLLPRSKHRIRPFAAEHFPGAFVEPDCEVEAINAERTFWDKATILHAEYHRSAEKPIPIRYSRHFADMAMMTKTPVKNRALADLNLLTQAVDHKMEYYYNQWASYESATPRTLRLVPPVYRRAELGRDYESMKIMFMGVAPPFDQIMDELASLEQEIRQR